MEGDVPEYLAYTIVDLHMSYVESICDDTKEEPGEIMDRYGLKPVFKEYGVLPSYYKDCQVRRNEQKIS